MKLNENSYIDEPITEAPVINSRPYRIEGKNFDIYVDELQRTVVAVLKNPYQMAKKDLRHIFEMAFDKAIPQYRLQENVSRNFFHKTVRGKSKCHPDDVFDLKLGIRIAKARCMNNYRKQLTRILVEQEGVVEDVLEEIRKKITALENTTRCEKFIEELR